MGRECRGPSRIAYTSNVIIIVHNCVLLSNFQDLQLYLWLVVSKGMLPVKYFCSLMPLFVSVEFIGGHKTAYKDDVKSDHPHFWVYYRL